MPRNPFNNLWAQDPAGNDINTFQEPTGNQWDNGWVGGASGSLPYAGPDNWRGNRSDVALQQIERIGAMVWHPEARYIVGAEVVGSNGSKYYSVSGTEESPNVGNNPVSDNRNNWSVYAHDSSIIKLSSAIPQVPGAENVQQALEGITAFAASGAQNIIYWTVSGPRSFQVPDVLRNGYRKAYVRIVGGGGGGAKFSSGSVGGGGGGAGGVAEGFIDLKGIATLNMVVGSGGSGAGNISRDGYSGSSTSIGQFASASGGGGGNQSGAGGPSGSGNGLDIQYGGGFGHYGVTTRNGNAAGGNGGGVGGGRGQASNASAGAAPGAGGGGSGAEGTAAEGANGIIIIWW